jgi:phosphotriesterase-related protein
MVNYNLAGRIQTVLGPIDPERLGVTLPHEHLLSDGTPINAPQPPEEASAKDLYFKPLSLETVGLIRYYAAPNFDDRRLLDIRTAIEEAMLYRQHGGNSIVDCTSVGLGRDPVGLARISRATGLNIVMGGSYYTSKVHPPDMDCRSEDEIVEKIVRDVTEGVDGTGIKTGILGEVGCSWPLTDNERKVLRSTGRAQQLTGAPITIHPGQGDERAPLEILEVLDEVGTDLSRVTMGHIERTAFQNDIFMRLAESGCYIEWDLFGREDSFHALNLKIELPGEGARIDQIAWLSSQGYADKVLISQDIGSKRHMVRYGGHGYFYILRNTVPRMRNHGFSEEAIHRILVENPRRVLTFSKPTEA